MEIRHWSLNLSYMCDWLVPKHTCTVEHGCRAEVVMYVHITYHIREAFWRCITFIVHVSHLHQFIRKTNCPFFFVSLGLCSSTFTHKKPMFPTSVVFYPAHFYFFKDRIIKENMRRIFSQPHHQLALHSSLMQIGFIALSQRPDHVGLNIVHTSAGLWAWMSPTERVFCINTVLSPSTLLICNLTARHQ